MTWSPRSPRPLRRGATVVGAVAINIAGFSLLGSTGREGSSTPPISSPISAHVSASKLAGARLDELVQHAAAIHRLFSSDLAGIWFRHALRDESTNSARRVSHRNKAVDRTGARPPTSANPPTTGMSLAFSATFSRRRLDKRVWQTCYPWFSHDGGCTNFGNPDEREWYLPSQVQVTNRALHLVSMDSPTIGWSSSNTPEIYQYASGMVTTFASFHFKYGYIQIVAKIPGMAGTWPALWLLPRSRAWPPEIDIMENWGSPHSVTDSVWWGSPAVPAHQSFSVTSTTDLASGWHVYGLLWEPGSLTWYLDGKPVANFRGSDVPSQPMYFLANLAIYGSASRASSFDIQSVKVWDH